MLALYAGMIVSNWWACGPTATRNRLRGVIHLTLWVVFFAALDDFFFVSVKHELFAHANGFFDRAVFRSAVTNQKIPADAEQRRAAIFLPIVLPVNLLHHRLE